jgi:3-methyladenine DNA glycosylase AlkD
MLVDRLSRSRDLWDRRIAVVAHHRMIRDGRTGPFFRFAPRLLDDPHDLIHKAVGWMLREAGKADEASLVAFLDEHAARMPRTMLRYAIERLPVPERRRFMAVRPLPAPISRGGHRRTVAPD